MCFEGLPPATEEQIDYCRALPHLWRGGVLAVAGADGGDHDELADSLLESGLDQVDVALAVGLRRLRGAADGGDDGVDLLHVCKNTKADPRQRPMSDDHAIGRGDLPHRAM